MLKSIYSALSGIKINLFSFNKQAENIANINSEGYKQKSVVQTEEPVVKEKQAPEIKNGSNVELTSAIVESKVAEYGVKANIKTIKTADEVLGEILDIKQ